MVFCKLKDNTLIYPQKTIIGTDGKIITNFNTNIELMRLYGFKELVDEKPTYDEETQYIETSYSEDDNFVYVVYKIVEKEKPEPIPPTPPNPLETEVKELRARVEVMQGALDELLINIMEV